MSRPPVAVGRVRPRAALGALGVLWRFSRPHTLIGTSLSIVALYAIAAQFSFLLPGTPPVRVTATDKDGGVGSDDKTINVTNVAPTPAITGAPAPLPIPKTAGPSPPTPPGGYCTGRDTAPGSDR